METNVADERLQFVRDFTSGHWSMTELCERTGCRDRPAINGSRGIEPTGTAAS